LCAGDTEPEFESKRCPTYHRKDYCLTNPHSPTSVDYFGPLEIKRGIAVVKRWGAIFTCMTSRAVHIEVANSLDTSSCINALRRFISRRGQVKRLRSDNGTNFVGAKRELQKAFSAVRQDQIQKTLREQGIEWTFNPPGASHHGGIWERMIRSVRQVLCSVLKEQTVNDEGLHTIESRGNLKQLPFNNCHF
jgi:transposase InsO family protein